MWCQYVGLVHKDLQLRSCRLFSTLTLSTDLCTHKEWHRGTFRAVPPNIPRPWHTENQNDVFSSNWNDGPGSKCQGWHIQHRSRTQSCVSLLITCTLLNSSLKQKLICFKEDCLMGGPRCSHPSDQQTPVVFDSHSYSKVPPSYQNLDSISLNLACISFECIIHKWF